MLDIKKSTKVNWKIYLLGIQIKTISLPMAHTVNIRFYFFNFLNRKTNSEA